MSYPIINRDWKPGEPPHLHHIDSKGAYESAKLGMWLFLATEILLFAGMFCAFILYNWRYFNEFHHASAELNWKLGGLNTLVLLFSSVTAALAVDAAQKNNNRGIVKYFSISIICGLIFLAIKYVEWSTKASHGLFPLLAGEHGAWLHVNEYRTFFGLYYCMTGVHGLHVILGMGILAWCIYLARQNRFSARYYQTVENAALYWHLVDLIWIFLFPLLYLVG